MSHVVMHMRKMVRHMHDVCVTQLKHVSLYGMIKLEAGKAFEQHYHFLQN